MTVNVKLWRLGLVALAALGLAFYLGRSSVRHQPSSSLQAPIIQQAFADPKPVRAHTAREFREWAAAVARVRSLFPAIESYKIDNTPGGQNDPDAQLGGPIAPNAFTTDSGYTGMTVNLLRNNYDNEIPGTDWVNPTDSGYPIGVARVYPNATHYCAISQVGDWYAWTLGPTPGPTGLINGSQDPAAVCRPVSVSQ